MSQNAILSQIYSENQSDTKKSKAKKSATKSSDAKIEENHIHTEEKQVISMKEKVNSDPSNSDSKSKATGVKILLDETK